MSINMVLSREVILEQLVLLIINQDKIAANWVRFLIATESALAVAFAGIANYYSIKNQAAGGDILVLLPISVVGIIVTSKFSKIIIRERQWQKWYVQQVQLLTPNSSPIYSCLVGEPKTKVDDFPAGEISTQLSNMTSLISGLWWLISFVILVLGVCFFLKSCVQNALV